MDSLDLGNAILPLARLLFQSLNILLATDLLAQVSLLLKRQQEEVEAVGEGVQFFGL